MTHFPMLLIFFFSFFVRFSDSTNFFQRQSFQNLPISSKFSSSRNQVIAFQQYGSVSLARVIWDLEEQQKERPISQYWRNYSDILITFQTLIISFKDFSCFSLLETNLWLLDWYQGVLLHVACFGTAEDSMMKVPFLNIAGAVLTLEQFSQILLTTIKLLVFASYKN